MSTYPLFIGKGPRVYSDGSRRRSTSWRNVSKAYASPIPVMTRSVLRTPRVAYWKTCTAGSSKTPISNNGATPSRVNCYRSKAIPAIARRCCSAELLTSWISLLYILLISPSSSAKLLILVLTMPRLSCKVYCTCLSTSSYCLSCIYRRSIIMPKKTSLKIQIPGLPCARSSQIYCKTPAWTVPI